MAMLVFDNLQKSKLLLTTTMTIIITSTITGTSSSSRSSDNKPGSKLNMLNLAATMLTMLYLIDDSGHTISGPSRGVHHCLPKPPVK